MNFVDDWLEMIEWWKMIEFLLLLGDDDRSAYRNGVEMALWKCLFRIRHRAACFRGKRVMIWWRMTSCGSPAAIVVTSVLGGRGEDL